MTLSAIKKLRVLVLATFAFATVLFAATLSRNGVLSGSSMLAAHMALFVFVCTEAFGPVSQRRGRANKVIARLAFCIYALFLLCFISFSAWQMRT